MCRCQGLVRRFASGRGSRKVCMEKVTFSETDEVREYNTEDTPADPLPPDPAEQTSTGKRGRPTKPVETLSPLQLSEKRMRTAEETYHGEKDALYAKVIELKDSHAWLDHPSVVARLDERLDKRCRKVVALGMEWEDRKREWESERAKETERAAEERLEMLNNWEECIWAWKVLRAHNVQLEAEKRELRERISEIYASHDHIESLKAKIAANEAVIEAGIAAKRELRDRERVLWLRGIL